MDLIRVKRIMQFALAIAAENDDWRDRRLGPIHLIKYVYLADLAYAQGEGETYTSLDWKFHHFGPYSTAAWEATGAAMREIRATEHFFQSSFKDEPVERWASRDPGRDVDCAGKDLPISIRLAVKRAVRQLGADTKALLHHVYSTPPMLRTAPGERISFRRTAGVRPVPADVQSPISRRKQKKRAETVRRLREETAERIRARRARRSRPTKPRYDDLYNEGVDWLESLQNVTPHKGTLTIDDSIWKSDTRGEDVDS